MKKIITVLSILTLFTVLSACELTHIKSQFKKNSKWISDDEKIEMIFEGPIVNLASGYISFEEKTKVIYKITDTNEQLLVFDEESIVNNEPLIIFDLEVVINDKKFVPNQVSLILNQTKLDLEVLNEYQTVITRTGIEEENLSVTNFMGINFFNDLYGMKIEYKDDLFFDGKLSVRINDRPQNIFGTFEFKSNQIFEIKKDEKLLLTGVYKFENNILILQFGTNDLYHDTNTIELTWYT